MLEGNVTAETLKEQLTHLAITDKAIRWRQGDVIVQLLGIMPKMEAYRAAAEKLGASESWAFYLAKVAMVFPPDTDRGLADWNIYRVAATYSDPKAALDKAVAEGLTPEELTKWVRSQKFGTRG